MNENEKINFQEVREFGDLVSVTFTFIRQNFKPLGKALLYIAGPFVLLTGLFTSTMLIRVITTWSPETIKSFPEWINSMASFSLLNYVFTFVTTTVMAGVVYEYIVLYLDYGPSDFTFTDVMESLKEDSLHILGLALLTAFLVTAGMFLFFLPGIYLGVVFSPVFMVLLYEKQSITDSFSRCFQLISGHWWFTFGYLIVLFFILSIISIIISLPHTIITDTLMFNSASGHLSKNSQIIILISSIVTSVTTFLYAIPMVGIAFHYFNLVERKEGTGLLNRIDEMDKNTGL